MVAVDASEILEAPRRKLAKFELFKALLNEDDAEDALEEYDGPDSTSLMSLVRYKGESTILQSLQRVADLVRSGLIARQRQLLSELDNVFSALSVVRLSDPTQYFSLRLPSVTESRSSPATCFTFVGRPDLKILADEIQRGLEKSSRRIDYVGPPGRGKSYILAALAGHHIIRSSLPVVYILSERYVSKPLEHLRMALLLAFWKHPRQQVAILRCRSVEELAEWCVGQTEKLLFLIDEANCFDDDKQTAPTSKEDRQLARKHLSEAVSTHWAVWCASIQSSCSTYKPSEKEAHLELERPFNDKELMTWLTVIEEREKRHFSSCRELLYYTGYIPRLLTEFARHSVSSYCKDVVTKIFKDFRRRAKEFSQNDLITLEKLLAGGRVPRETIDLDPSFFYVEDEEFDEECEECRVWCPCAYLERKARELVHSRLEQTYYMKLLDRIEDWSPAIHLDAERANPARMGWLVEGVVIDCLKVLGRLSDFSFKHFRTFHVGSEAEALKGCKPGELREGILFVPVQFNAKAIDVVLVKLAEGVLNVRGVQISITTWKWKEEKQSHVVWLQGMGVAWTLGLKHKSKPQLSFTYIISDVVAAAKAAEFASPQNGFQVMKFSNVDAKLCFIDELNIPEPSERRQCKGMTLRNQRCTSSKVQVAENYFCKDHEESSSKKPRI